MEQIDPMLTGEIPWAADELAAVLDHAVALHNTPHDDWERTEKGVNLLNDDGSVDRIRFNPDMIENQMMDYLISRLRKQGVTQSVMMSHGWRFMESMAFLNENSKRLRQEGLIIDDPDDADALLLSESLIAVLATVRYEGVKLQGPKREPVRTFHLERVIEAAKRLGADEQ